MESGHPSQLASPNSKANAPSTNEEIIFAGLSGSPPRYIDSGPDRGNGWLEFETREIRKGVQGDGIPLKLDWMTPARIAHEFRVGNPICTWPAKWQDPGKVFATKPDRIYSIPLRFEGNESHEILFHKTDAWKFKKHLRSNGDLNLNSLLKDQSLKTLLIRDYDYGPLVHEILETNQIGDQAVKKEYQSNVILLLIKNNLQILEMLNAHRFDYVFSDSIEAQDFETAKIDRTRFQGIYYQTRRITDLKDPNLVQVSVACSIHPLTLGAMPYFNKWISIVRGGHGFDHIRSAAREYRKAMDPKFDPKFLLDSLSNLFLGQIDLGIADTWYVDQQKYFPSLRLYPVEAPSSATPPPSQTPGDLRWQAKRVAPDSLLIFSESSQVLNRTKLGLGSSYFWSPYPEDLISRYLSPEEKRTLSLGVEPFEGAEAAKGFNNLRLKPFLGTKKLTLFAQGLTLSELKGLKPILNHLTEISVFGAGTEESSLIVDFLPPKLERINFTSSSLSHSNLHSKIKGMPLRALHLSNSQITARQLPELIANLPSSIQELSLGYLRSSLCQATGSFEKKRLPQLWYLDMEGSFLLDSHLDSISMAIPPGIKSLNLGHNRFSPQAIQRLLAREFPRLEELDLTLSRLGSVLQPTIRLPASVKKLLLKDAGLTAKYLDKIQLPKSLNFLDLSENDLGDEGIIPWLKTLERTVRHLDLSQTHLGRGSLAALTSAPIDRIKELNLSQNALQDSEIQALTSARFEIESLNLAHNRIHNSGANAIATKWLKTLKSIDLTSNPIGDEGVRMLSKHFGSGLEELSIGFLGSLDVHSLASALPRSLRQLSLPNNLLSNEDLQILAPHLPEGLLTLDLGFSQFSAPGMASLAQHLPKSLLHLRLHGTPIGDEGLRMLSLSLPSRLKSLSIGPVKPSRRCVELFSKFIPKGLRSLLLSSFMPTEGDLTPLAQSIPHTLQTLYFDSMPLSDQAARALDARWPSNLREAYFVGTALEDAKFANLTQNLPASIERMPLLYTQVGDQGLAAITKNPLENLYYLEWANNKFTTRGFNQFYCKFRNIRSIEIRGTLLINDEFLKPCRSEHLRNLNILDLTGAAISNDNIAQILKKLRPEVFHLGLGSTSMSQEGIGAVLKGLPKTLWLLDIRSNEIGQSGFNRFREFRKDQALKTGLLMDLIE